MVLKITRDELPMEQGVYGEWPLCPLYSLLAKTYSIVIFFSESLQGKTPGVSGLKRH